MKQSRVQHQPFDENTQKQQKTFSSQQTLLQTHSEDYMHNFAQGGMLAQTQPCPNLHKWYSLHASYSGVTVPSFHSIRISPRCRRGEECGKRMACSVSGALSLGTGDPGTLTSGLGVYDFRTHTTFFLLAQQDRKRQKWVNVQHSALSQSSLKSFSKHFFYVLP